MCVCVRARVCVIVCNCVCMCVCERERETHTHTQRDRENKREREREKETESVFIGTAAAMLTKQKHVCVLILLPFHTPEACSRFFSIKMFADSAAHASMHILTISHTRNIFKNIFDSNTLGTMWALT